MSPRSRRSARTVGTRTLSLVCSLVGHRNRLGQFDDDVLAYDFVCTRCGRVQSGADMAAWWGR